jgi:hypothetical protein
MVIDMVDSSLNGLSAGFPAGVTNQFFFKLIMVWFVLKVDGSFLS